MAACALRSRAVAPTGFSVSPGRHPSCCLCDLSAHAQDKGVASPLFCAHHERHVTQSLCRKNRNGTLTQASSCSMTVTTPLTGTTASAWQGITQTSRQCLHLSTSTPKQTAGQACTLSMEHLLTPRLERAFGVVTLLISGLSILAAPSANAPGADSWAHLSGMRDQSVVRPRSQGEFVIKDSPGDPQAQAALLQKLWTPADNQGDLRRAVFTSFEALETLRGPGRRDGGELVYH